MISKHDADKISDPTKTPRKMPPSRSFEILGEIYEIDILVRSKRYFLLFEA
jgi:hypothetical protein